MATFIVSHELSILLPFCSRVVMLHAGRLVFDGAAAQMPSSARPEVVQFVTGSDAGPL
jgi:ABC-type transporter Mla maintaining outer membrane lipid asymmetry ATPase subunit MlaF